MQGIEVWKPIEGTNGLYEISNHGRVRTPDKLLKRFHNRLALYRGRILKPAKDTKGYLYVGLHLTGKRGAGDRAHIHRLVAQHFLPPSELPEVHHKDHDPTNNVVSNLEWVTHQRNMDEARNAGRLAKVPHRKVKSSQYPAAKLDLEAIGFIKQAYAENCSYEDIALAFGVHIVTIRRIIAGKTWKRESP